MKSTSSAQPGICIDEVIRRVVEAAFGKPLITNVLRGQVAEAIVASALEPEWTWCAEDYSSWDFERADGLRLEVKQSASRQSWTVEGGPAPKPSFDIAARKERWEGTTLVAEPGRAAHIYVFAHHEIADISADHRDATQWRFYVVATAELPDTKRISLPTLRTICGPLSYGELASGVAKVAARVTES